MPGTLTSTSTAMVGIAGIAGIAGGWGGCSALAVAARDAARRTQTAATVPLHRLAAELAVLGTVGLQVLPIDAPPQQRFTDTATGSVLVARIERCRVRTGIQCEREKPTRPLEPGP